MAADTPPAPTEIVVATDASPAATYAAEELRECYREGAGEDLPVRDAPSADAGLLFVGPDAVADGPLDVATDDLGGEDLRAVVADGDAALVGGGPRGTLYAAYEFLEERLGVRFLAPEHTHVPDLDDVDVLAPMDHTYRPPLEFRSTNYGVAEDHPAYAARLRNNTIPEDERFGGRTSMRLISHTFDRWVSDEEYGDEHPEYFALEDGERWVQEGDGMDGTQPCMMNREVRDLVIEGVLDDLEEHPEWTNISVSQNDNDHYCKCEDCMELIEREGTPMGPLLDLVNEVADVVAEEHPDVQVGTLAYWYSRAPPETMEPRDNVQIQLCSIEACMYHPIDDESCESNVDFCEDFAEWGELSDQIYIWNYNVNFRNYLLPTPNLNVVEPNVRYFVDNGAKGAFMQAAGGASVAEFDTLRNYLISNLLWDPSADADELREEFLELHYQEAAEPIREWLDFVHDHVQDEGIHNNCFGDAEDFGITEDVVEEGVRLFDEALDRAESDAVHRRVERASLCIRRAEMEPAMLAMRDRGPWDDDIAAEQRPTVERFYELADDHGVTIPVEYTDLESEKERMRDLFDADEDAFTSA
jgi:hypothetical protein